MIPSLRQRPKERMNVREPERKESQRHRKFVRTGKYAMCIVPSCLQRPLEFCHVRAGLPAGEQAGMGEKPHDVFGFPACHDHHHEQHQIGEQSFERKYGVKLLETALQLAKLSTDPEIQAKARSLEGTSPRGREN